VKFVLLAASLMFAVMQLAAAEFRKPTLEQRDFLEFVEIAANGSAQLTDYVELGYAPIKPEPSHAVD
jgi:hypothetical protein